MGEVEGVVRRGGWSLPLVLQVMFLVVGPLHVAKGRLYTTSTTTTTTLYTTVVYILVIRIIGVCVCEYVVYCYVKLT